MKLEEILKQMTLEEKIDFFNGSSKGSMLTMGCERLGIRAQVLTDGPLGVRPDKNCVAFPCETSMAATWNKELLEEIGSAIADECIYMGRDMILGPGANIKRTPLCGRNFEYFSEDPVLSGKMAAHYIRGAEKKNIGTCVKHYAANNQETDRAFVSVDIDERTLREIYLKSFEIAVKEGNPSAVMTAHNRINGLKCSENPFILKEVLNDEWGFDGIVMSDWSDIKKPAFSITSGMTLAMPYDPTMKNAIKEGLNNGAITESNLDQAISKLIKFSQRGEVPKINYSRENQHQIAMKAAEEGIVLLKNEDNILPITPNKHKKIVVIGEFAEKPVYYGNGSARVFPYPENVDSALKALKDILADEIQIDYIPAYSSNRTPQDDIFDFVPNPYNDYGKTIADADLVLMFVGNQFKVETEDADRMSALLDTYYYSFINRVRCNNENIVLVVQTGSAVIPHLWDERAKAVVEMWYAGEAGGTAVANMLCGKICPSGKLPETFPTKLRTDYDYPGDGYKVCYDEKWAVGYRYYDLHPEEIAYPFGFGLSYTDFDYKNLIVTDNGETLEISFDVTNIGDINGREIAQIYIADPQTFVSKPKKELAEFHKTKELKPGESEHITLTINKEMFGYYSTNLHKILIEPGDYKILVGSSSRDIHLEGKYVHPNEMNYNVQPNGYTILG